MSEDRIISENGEQYTVVFHDMNESDYFAAMRLWRDEQNAISWDTGSRIVFSRVIEGKGYSFTVTVSGTAAPYEMTVSVQGGY